VHTCKKTTYICSDPPSKISGSVPEKKKEVMLLVQLSCPTSPMWQEKKQTRVLSHLNSWTKLEKEIVQKALLKKKIYLPCWTKLVKGVGREALLFCLL
jgi:hypothetical protein